MPAAHLVQWIRGKSSASRLNTSLDKTTSHCYLAAQNFLTLLPSWWKLYNPVLHGKQSYWALVVGLFISLACFFTLPVCIVDWPDISRKTLASLKEKIPCTKTFFVAYSAAGCKAGLIFHATSNFCDISCWIGSVYGGLCPGLKAWSLLQRTLCRAIHWPPWFQCLGSSCCNMTCDRDEG